jgi:hypothetical protein
LIVLVEIARIGLTASAPNATIGERLNNGCAMAIVNYSVPDEVKTQFNRALAREN